MYNVQCRVYIVFILVYYISANSQVSFRMILKIREVINLFNVITVTFNLFNVISVTFTFIEIYRDLDFAHDGPFFLLLPTLSLQSSSITTMNDFHFQHKELTKNKD